MRQRIDAPRFLSGSLTVLALLLAIPSLLMAKTGIVHTKDGKSLEGDVSETPDAVMVNIHGIQTTIARDDVASVEYTAGVEQEYKVRVAKIGKNDAKGHIELAKWLLDKKAYDLAAQEVDAAQRIDPSNGEAVTLYQVIVSQRRLEATARPAGSNTAGPKMTPNMNTGAGDTGPSRKYLSADDVNLLKQSEWKAADPTVRVRFQGDILKRYTSYASVNFADFKNGLTDQQKAWQILTAGLPEMRKDVRILNDPQPLAEFRTRIQPVVLNGCATASCHGGVSAPGGLFLYSPAENEAAAYTNFFLLDTYSNKSGKLIDRGYPNKSLLCQYALPASGTDVQHPEVPKGTAWKGIAPTGKDDPRYKLILNWISNSLVAVEPHYNINFTVAGGSKPPKPPAETPAP